MQNFQNACSSPEIVICSGLCKPNSMTCVQQVVPDFPFQAMSVSEASVVLLPQNCWKDLVGYCCLTSYQMSDSRQIKILQQLSPNPRPAWSRVMKMGMMFVFSCWEVSAGSVASVHWPPFQLLVLRCFRSWWWEVDIQMHSEAFRRIYQDLCWSARLCQQTLFSI